MTAFRVTWLSSNLFRDSRAIVPSVLDGMMTLQADDQRFMTTTGHDFDPLWLVRLTRALQVSESTNVMDFDVVSWTTQLTFLSE